MYWDSKKPQYEKPFRGYDITNEHNTYKLMEQKECTDCGYLCLEIEDTCPQCGGGSFVVEKEGGANEDVSWLWEPMYDNGYNLSLLYEY